MHLGSVFLRGSLPVLGTHTSVIRQLLCDFLVPGMGSRMRESALPGLDLKSGEEVFKPLLHSSPHPIYKVDLQSYTLLDA